MKYAPTIWDFQSGFFLVERAKEPYFLISPAGQVLRTNRVGERFLNLLNRTKPRAIEALLAGVKELLAKPGQKALTTVLNGQRKRVLRAIPVGTGEGFFVEIDH